MIFLYLATSFECKVWWFLATLIGILHLFNDDYHSTRVHWLGLLPTWWWAITKPQTKHYVQLVDWSAYFMVDWSVHFSADFVPNLYSSVPNKRTCTPYLISNKLPPCTLLFGTGSLSIFWIFVKYSGLIWNFFGKN